MVEGEESRNFHTSQPFAANPTPFAAYVLHGLARRRLAKLKRDRLLTVREVAVLMAVSTATVYSLIERGDLFHVRVSNVIRVPPEAFMGMGGGRGKRVAGAEPAKESEA
jgi:excisionase family DNA binding protein